MKTNTLFVIVCFLDAVKLGTKLKVVELLPRSWVFCSRTVWFSSYPPEEDYVYVGKWVSESKKPNKSWKQYKCKIVSECGKQKHNHN